jgi:hypothetical protein
MKPTPTQQLLQKIQLLEARLQQLKQRLLKSQTQSPLPPKQSPK